MATVQSNSGGGRADGTNPEGANPVSGTQGKAIAGAPQTAEKRNPAQHNVRNIPLGASRRDVQEKGFPNNYVSTTKYEIWNIVPKNLAEQFSRIANFWFLTVSIFQMLPLELSPTSKFATLTPLCGVLFIKFCKDAWEDNIRGRDDRRVNNQKCKVVPFGEDLTSVENDETLMEVKWTDVYVGAYVKLERDQPVPADMICISTSSEGGMAFVDTAQLDGETTLKPKFALEETMRISTMKELRALEGHVDSEPPNERVPSFSGALVLRGFPRGIHIDARNFILRGSTLRNTQWVYGLVVFTGVDTKLVRNLKDTPFKRSSVEVAANRLLLIVFGVLVFVATLSAIARALYLHDSMPGQKRISRVWPDLDGSEKVKDNEYLAFITFMIGYNNLIPISLYLTIDLVRTFQGLNMERDPTMYHPTTNSYCRVRNTGLNENLGQVEFVLTDKTGTLTDNQMNMKACSIGGRIYGCWDEEEGAVERVVSIPPLHICTPLDLRFLGAQGLPEEPSAASHCAFFEDSEEQRIDQFFFCLAMCHTAIPEECPEKNRRRDSFFGPYEEPPLPPTCCRGSGVASTDSAVGGAATIGRSSLDGGDATQTETGAFGATYELIREARAATFRSSSPDEEALVAAARDFGYYFRKKCGSRSTVNIRGKDQDFTVMMINEFSSDRKRMSVLVRPYEQQAEVAELGAKSPVNMASFGNDSSFGARGTSGKESWAEKTPGATLYIKGADNVMLERMHQAAERQAPGQDIMVEQLKAFSICGLRTLVCAKREMSGAEVARFVHQMHQAKSAFMNHDAMVEAVADQMERELEFLGITAIEDKIQQGVPDTIHTCLSAGVKVWMLTGDNMETALNIAMACRLIDVHTKQYKLDAGHESREVHHTRVQHTLDMFYDSIRNMIQAESAPGKFKYSVVVHGKVLYTVLNEHNPRLRQLFLAIAVHSRSVVACRLAPAQKAALVKLIRYGVAGSPLTLAIGDGGNDVSMIQEAHVGVGILGLEGRQAANASDIVIGQFRFLTPLMFVHGRWNLRRIGIVIGYSFYKNVVLVLPMVFYAPYTGFSGTTLYDSYLLTCYNLFFTSLPILIVGIYDLDVNDKMARMVPSLYQSGVNCKYFNGHMLCGWIARGVYHAIVLFFTMQAIFTGSLADSSEIPGGRMADYLVMGSWAYGAGVLIVNVTLLVHAKSWMDWFFFIVLGSLASFVPAMAAYSNMSLAQGLNGGMLGVSAALSQHLRLWLGVLLSVGICAFTELAIAFAWKVIWPDAADILQEVQLGHLAGVPEDAPQRKNIKGESTLAEAILQSLEPAEPPSHDVRPVGRVGLRNLRDPSRKEGSKRKLAAVIPVADTEQEEGDLVVPELSDRYTAYPGSCWERGWMTISSCLDKLWQWQWREMKVDELSVNLDGDTLAVSKQFKKSSNRLAGTDAARSSEKAAERQETENGRSSTVDGSINVKQQPEGGKDSNVAYRALSRKQPENESDDNDVSKDMMYSCVTLRFRGDEKEAAFEKHFFEQAVQLFQKSLLAVCGGLLMYNLYELVVYEASRTLLRGLLCGLLLLPAATLSFWLLRTSFFEQRAEMCIILVVVTLITTKHIYDVVMDSSGILGNSYMPVLIIAGARIRFTYIVVVLLYHIVCLFTRYWWLADHLVTSGRLSSILPAGEQLFAEYFVPMLGITGLSLYYAYQLENMFRHDFIVMNSIRRSKHQTMEILCGIFPDEVISHVVGQLRREGESHDEIQEVPRISEDRGIVTILFCDICDFDGLVETLEPIELVQLLDLVWMMFSRICDNHQVTKIETVGKTYMAAAIPDSAESSTERHIADATAALLTAIGMLEQVARRVLGLWRVTKVSVQIGMHTGRALSGVVGTQKPQFALFGDTVNTASRMQSTGKKHRVHVSGATWQLLQHDPRFLWEHRRTPVKGKGVMDTYILSKYDDQSLLSSRSMGASSASLSSRPAAVGAAAGISTTSEVLIPKPAPSATAPDIVVDSRPAELAPAPAIAAPTDASVPRANLQPDMDFGDPDDEIWPLSLVDKENSAQPRPTIAAMLEQCWNSLKLRVFKAKGLHMRAQWVSFAAFLACYACESAAVMVRVSVDVTASIVVVVVRGLYLGVALLVLAVLHKVGRKHGWGSTPTNYIPCLFADVIAVAVFVGFLCSALSNTILVERVSEFWNVFESFFFVMVLMHLCRLNIHGVVPLVLCVTAIVIGCIIAFTEWTELLPDTMMYSLLISCTQLLATLGDPRRDMEEQEAMCVEHARVTQLLDDLLPREVIAEMLAGNLSLAYQYEDMTFLFADIVSFTKYCNTHTAEQAVNLVTNLFAAFDEQAVKLGLYKVCTVGDAYVAVNEPRMQVLNKYNDCVVVLNMAKWMLQTITRVREQVKHAPLDMRIGMHYGRFIGGVIGTKRLRFDIWGEDVLIGTQVESHGHAGQIFVSEAAKQMLEESDTEGLTFTFIQNIETKGRVVPTYLLTTD